MPHVVEELVQTHRELYPDAELGGELKTEGKIFVAEEEGRVLGFAGLLWHGRKAELEPIVVAPDARERGVGRALVERIVEEAKAEGAVRVFVQPVGRNRDAIAFFHELGFDTLGYVQLQIDVEPRNRKPGERIAGRDFMV